MPTNYSVQLPVSRFEMQLSSYSGRMRNERRGQSSALRGQHNSASISLSESDVSQGHAHGNQTPQYVNCLQTMRKSAASRLGGPAREATAEPLVEPNRKGSSMIFSRQRVLAGSLRPTQSGPSSPNSTRSQDPARDLPSDQKHSRNREPATSNLSVVHVHEGSHCGTAVDKGNTSNCRQERIIGSHAYTSPLKGLLYFTSGGNSAGSASPSVVGSPLKGSSSRLTLLRPVVLGATTTDVVRAYSMGGIVSLASSPLAGAVCSPRATGSGVDMHGNKNETDAASRNILADFLQEAAGEGVHPFGSLYSSCAASPTADSEGCFPLADSTGRRADTSKSPHRDDWGLRSGSPHYSTRQMTPFGSERSLGSSIKEEVEEELRELTTRIASIVLRSRQRVRARMRAEEKEAQLKRLEERLYGVVEAREREDAERKTREKIEKSRASVVDRSEQPELKSESESALCRDGSEQASDAPLPTAITTTAPPSSNLTFSPPPFVVPLPMPCAASPLETSAQLISPRASPRASPRGLCVNEDEARGASDILLESKCVVVPLWPEREYCRVIILGADSRPYAKVKGFSFV